MAIHYVPNDLRASDFNATVERTPRPNRAAGVAGFTLSAGPPPAIYPTTSADFVYWQAREAALTAVEAFEDIYGQKVTRWARSPTPKKLTLRHDAGVDLNAYYDGRSLSFFHKAIGKKNIFSGASTDVVAHEAGHALLDFLRPDLWDEMSLEIAAFHEAFGDCMAILTALSDADMRKKMVGKGGLLGKNNFIETTAEELSWAIKQLQGNHNAATPRKARNKYKWVLPSSLPDNGAPGALINEVHSFGQVFTGCFYDLLLLLYQNGGPRTEAGLRSATKIVGQLLIAGAKDALVRDRFFRSVGQAMLQADSVLFAGKYGALIGEAFKNHNLDLTVGAVLSPRTALAGRVSSVARNALDVSAATMKDIRVRLRADPKVKFERRAISVGAQSMVELRNFRAVDLTGIAEYLQGVKAYASEPVVVGRGAGAAAALMSALPDPGAAQDEALVFVTGLAKHGQIDRNGFAGADSKQASTHRVIKRGKEKVLERKRFACGCGQR